MRRVAISRRFRSDHGGARSVRTGQNPGARSFGVRDQRPRPCLSDLLARAAASEVLNLRLQTRVHDFLFQEAISIVRLFACSDLLKCASSAFIARSQDTSMANMPGMGAMHQFSRMGSGTSWLPDAIE